MKAAPKEYDGGSLPRVLKIFFHDGCFDGTASAALFSAFYRDVHDRSVDVRPVGMAHRDGDPFEGVPLDADDHACVDFRFCSDPKMTWWFDHHPTAFQPPALRDIFDRERKPTWFYEPKAASCAGLMAHVLQRHYNWRPPARLADLVEWADKIDSANFASAEDAVALQLPAQRLAAWLAHGRTGDDTARYIGWLAHGSLAEVAERPELVAQVAAIQARRAHELEAVQKLGVWHDDVIVFDRLAEVGARSPGFLAYVVFPRSLYAVAASRTATTIKISVGMNPWTTASRRPPIDVGALCSRLGGGGHASVGGITLRADEMDRARQTVAELVRELTSQRPGSASP